MKKNFLFKSTVAFMVVATVAGTVIPTRVFAEEINEETSFTNEEQFSDEDFMNTEYTDYGDNLDEYFEDAQDEYMDEYFEEDQDECQDEHFEEDQVEYQDEYLDEEQDEYMEDVIEDDFIDEDIDNNTNDNDCENEEPDSEDMDYEDYEVDFSDEDLVIEYDNEGDISEEDFADFDGDCCIESTQERGPVIDMGIHNIFLGYHGSRVDYEDLVPGKFYLMQIPRRAKIPTFKFCVVKIIGRHTNKGVFFDDVMVKYDKYDNNGKLIARNKETQVNTNLLNMTPNHFYEITDDILVK